MLAEHVPSNMSAMILLLGALLRAVLRQLPHEGLDAKYQENSVIT